MSQSWDYISKLICLGDSGCGKSSLTIRLCEGRFSPRTDTTIGVEFGSRIVPVGPPASTDDSAAGIAPTKTPDNPIQQSPNPNVRLSKDGRPVQKYMKLSLWDTAGQETYKSITKSYFRGASGALLVFDITRRNTFESVTSWLNDLRSFAEEGIVVVLVGNKSDLAPASTVSSAAGMGEENKRQVTKAEAQDWCKANGVLKYVETSAKSGDNVEHAFLEVAERIFHNIEAGKYDLNDRRSGVKSASAGGQNLNSAKTVNLGISDVSAGGKSKGGGCC